MESFELAPGLTVSRVVTGLWQIADLERDGRSLDLERAVEAMRPYAEAGLTTFDMADHYGSAEIIAGRFRKRYDGEVQLLTKWVPKPGQSSPATVRKGVELALRRLDVERLDLLQFHAWSYPDPSYLDCLFELEKLRDEGLIQYLGGTNFDTAHLRIVLESGVRLVSNQVCFSLLDRRPQAGMLALCREHDVGLLAYGTLAGGLLTERYLDLPEPDAKELETWSLMKYQRFLAQAGGWQKLQEVLGALQTLARDTGASMAQLATRYVLDQPGVAGAIIGARLSVSEHVDENRALSEVEVDPSSWAGLEDALESLEPIPGDCGDEYRRPPFLTASGDLSHHFDEMPAPYEVQKTDRETRERALSGTIWEDLAGFSRAVRDGRRILISGTTATHGDRVVGGNSALAQTHFVIDKLEGAMQSLGGRLEDTIRTRIYVPQKGDWEATSKAHGERFRDIQPANTLVRAELVGDEYLVEIEAEALLPE